MEFLSQWKKKFGYLKFNLSERKSFILEINHDKNKLVQDFRDLVTDKNLRRGSSEELGGRYACLFPFVQYNSTVL